MRALHLVLTVLFQTLRVLGRSCSDLILENLALRQQVAVLGRTKRRPRFQVMDRWIWLALVPEAHGRQRQARLNDGDRVAFVKAAAGG